MSGSGKHVDGKPGVVMGLMESGLHHLCHPSKEAALDTNFKRAPHKDAVL